MFMLALSGGICLEFLFVLRVESGAHPAYFKGGEVLKKNSIPHSGADPENFGGGMKF